MLLNVTVQNAIVILKSLKENEEKNTGSLISIIDVAKAYELSYEFLCQIALKLRKAGWISSVRGPGGGYVLVKKDFNLLELNELLSSKTKLHVAHTELMTSINRKLESIQVV